MSHNLLYTMLAAVFLLVSGLALALGSWWSRRWSQQGKALSGRLAQIAQMAQQQRSQRPDSLLRSGDTHAPWLRWVLAHAPGAEALRGLLRRAASPHTPAQLMGLTASLGLFGWGLPVGWLKLPWWLALLPAAMAFLAPLLWLMHREKKRRLRFEDQLPEALDFMTCALRAGYGLSVALGMVGDELPEPVGGEFKTCFEQISVGISFEDAMAEMAERIHSNDLNFLVIALNIQRKTGGNLTELLVSLAKTVRERIKLKGKVRVLASEGKLSGVMIGALPFVLGAILSLINPIYMSTLWTTEAGQTLMLVGVVMIALGALWMWKIVQIQV